MKNGKGIAIGVGVALASVGAAYAVGRMQGAARVEQAESRAAAATSASASGVSLAQMNVAIERAKVSRLEGRRRLHFAIVALDDRNFGIAQEQLGAARGFFAASKGDDPELAKLAAEIEAFKIVATDDVGEQRKKVLDWCRRFDSLMPPPSP